MMPLKDTKEHNLIGLHKRKDRPKDARLRATLEATMELSKLHWGTGWKACYY